MVTSARRFASALATTAHKRETLLLAALLCAHVLLGVYYSVTIPIWEAHDEIGHYYFVRYLATEHRLPAPGQRLVEENDESRQPPLYYLLASLPLAMAGVGDDAAPHLNPHMSRPEGEGGYNRTVHDLAAESWPYHGTVLAVHIARWASVVLGACGLLFTFYMARQAFPTQTSIAWGAVLIQAFWPQYRFTTAVVNNDIMAVVCAGALTWLLVTVVTSPKPRPLDMAALIVLLGLALMAKNTTLPLLPVVLLVLAASVLRSGDRARRRILGYACGGLAIAIGAVAWWYLRNVAAGAGMFGGPYSLRFVGILLSSILHGGERISWSLAPTALRAGLTSLWAGYGWNNVGPPLMTYRIAAIWSALGVLGLLIWSMRLPAALRIERRAVQGHLLALDHLHRGGEIAQVAIGVVEQFGRFSLQARLALSSFAAKCSTGQGLCRIPRRGLRGGAGGGCCAPLLLGFCPSRKLYWNVGRSRPRRPDPRHPTRAPLAWRSPASWDTRR